MTKNPIAKSVSKTRTRVKPDKKTKYNRKGFHTDNFTQDLSKGSPRERALATTTEETPSGEQGLPDLH